jgi:hypothetical protein
MNDPETPADLAESARAVFEKATKVMIDHHLDPKEKP